MAHYSIAPPITERQVSVLRAGDTVTLNGIIFGIRDANMIRLFDHGIPLPEELRAQLRGAVCLHTAPNVKQHADGTFTKVCIGTTTSYRMDRFTSRLMEEYGVRAIAGKGGLLEAGCRALTEQKGCYFTVMGGAAAIETMQVESIEGVWWEDLMPEAIWKFKVGEFGPLTVSIDAHGNNLYRQVTDAARRNLQSLVDKIDNE